MAADERRRALSLPQLFLQPNKTRRLSNIKLGVGGKKAGLCLQEDVPREGRGRLSSSVSVGEEGERKL